MRVRWLESNAVSMLFLCSAIELTMLFAYAAVIAIPAARQFFNSSSANNVFGILFAALLLIGMPASVIISFGLAIFCACLDSSSRGTKVLWFLLFFGTWPIGSMFYYFIRYRSVIKRNRTLSAVSGSATTLPGAPR